MYLETPDCQACGEIHAKDCPWEQTCAECMRTDAEMHAPRLCVDCHETNERVARCARARDIYESHGDCLRDIYESHGDCLRDMMKDRV